MKPKEFLDKVWPVIKRRTPNLSYKSRVIVATHAVFESGWGAAKAFKQGNNLFNITRTPTDPRPVILGGDLEYKKNGSVSKIVQRFAAYATIDGSVEHYLEFIDKPRYHPAMDELEAEDVGGFVSALYKGGYFTLPLADYLSRFSNVMTAVKELTDQMEQKIN